jgi:tetratricopeptide (TPR) repeat protein
VIASRPNFDEAWHQRGTILFHVGHLEGARRVLEQCLAINPTNVTARARIPVILLYQLKYEEALASLQRVPKGALPTAAYQMNWALLSLGRLLEAMRGLAAALREQPNDPGGVLHGARAMLRAKAGDRRGAEADIAEAIRIGKGFGHFHHTAYSIGAVYSLLGEFEKAQQWIENAAADGFPCFTLFERDPHLERLRATPKFHAFLTRLRQEWEHIPGEPD